MTSNNIFSHRWHIALIIFVLCVTLRISGSSIGVYNQIFPTKIVDKESTWLGSPRWIRSDEYAVQTMQFFSQEFNGYNLFSQQMGISKTNMVLDYYSPVKHITAVGKPFAWGYLMFGSEVGLSWYWCGLIILIFMTAMEMLLILTENDRLVSVLGACAVTLAPAVTWWVMPHVPIVFFYAMGLFCVGYHFFTAGKYMHRLLCSGLAVVLSVGFTLSIFPSFQVPCAYAVFILLIVCLWRDKKKISFTKKEWYLIALPVAISLGILAHFAYISQNDFHILLNTVYPGERMDCGGANTWRDLFTDLTSLYLPYHDITYLNNCEASTFIHFAPFFVLLSPKIFLHIKRSRPNALYAGAALLGILAACAFFMCVGVPLPVSKITLLRYCNRMKGVYGWVATLFTFWGLHIILSCPDLLKKWEKIAYPAAYGCLCLLLIEPNMLGYFRSFKAWHGMQTGIILLALEVALYLVMLFSITFNYRRLLCGLLCAVMLAAGATVNPIEHGAGAITNHPISRCVRDVSKKEPEARWLCTDCIWILSNFIMANGARVVSATNFYPDCEKWNIIDPNGKYNEYTNRYANQSVKIGVKNDVRLLLPDYIEYTLTPDKVRALQIKYLFSKEDYSNLLAQHGIICTPVADQDGYVLYRLTY